MAGIIKAGGRPTADRDPKRAVFNLADLTENAQERLDRIRDEANQILAEARREAAQIRSAAQQEGRQAAVAAAEKSLASRLEQQLATALPAIGKIVAAVEQSRDAWMRQWESSLLRLAGAIAARVIRRELSADPDIPLAYVREALELTSDAGEITLRLHPDDAHTLHGAISEIAGQLGRLGRVEIVSDDQVARGGCLLTTQFGAADQRIETQIARILDELDD